MNAYKMLIVDDEPLTRQFFAMNVSRLHPSWICAGEAGDGEEALAMIEAGRQFDLVLTDIKMPAMSGLELAKALSVRKDAPHVAVLSGYDEFTLAKEAMAYGVHHYLLKPIVNEELVRMLSDVAQRLEAERAEAAAFRSLLSLSAETKEQVARNMLRAVVTENHMEINMLYPMMHRLKISLLDAEGTVLVAELDECELIERNVTAASAALYRYIVHQTAVELAGAARPDDPPLLPFIDHRQRTAVFVAGDDGEDVLRRCRTWFRELATTVYGMTKLRLWGACGAPEMELLQLGGSYRQASAALQRKWFADPADHLELLGYGGGAEERSGRLERAILSLRADPEALRGPLLRDQLAEISRELAPLDRRRLLLLGGAVLRRWTDGRPEGGLEARCMRALRDLSDSYPDDGGETGLTDRQAASLIVDMLEKFHGLDRNTGCGEAGAADEHELVAKAKAYILERYAEPLSLAHLAETFGVSPNYLSSLFHHHAQESYIKFLTRVRMERAAALLGVKPAAKVYDVAEKVGYVSVKHFSYVFKQHFGVPPGQFQEMARRR